MKILIPLLITIISIGLFSKSNPKKRISLPYLFLLLVTLILCGTYYFADRLSGNGIDESLLYHIKAGLHGAGIADFKWLIIQFIIYSSITLGALAWLVKQSLQTQKKTTPIPFISSVLLLFIANATNPAFSDIYTLYQSSIKPRITPETFLVQNKINFNGRPKNIVYLYLESLERTYLDQTLFPGLTPNLTNLEKQAVSLTNITQVAGTGWTMAGMVASQCGIPLFTISGGNSMFGVDKFLPDATCLGDILSGKGYSLNYINGGRINFAGKDKFYATHHFDKVDGLYQLRNELDDPTYLSRWGLYDDTLYTIAKKRYESLTAKGKPFGLFLLTLDTHHPKGHMANLCKNVSYGEGNNPILNSVHCADKMAGDFIRYILTSESFENTLLVVASDHLAMPNTAESILKRADRRNLFLLFKKGEKPKIITKTGSQLDIAPTILNQLGANIYGLGFGRDLLSTTPTLAETENSINKHLRQHSPFINSLWSFPDIYSGIEVNLDKKELKLGDRYVHFPALFILNKKLDAKHLVFEYSSPKSLPDYILSLNHDTPFLWIDSCNRVLAITETIASTKEKYCSAFGSLGSKHIRTQPLTHETVLNFSSLKKWVSSNTNSAEIYKKRISNFRGFKLFGTQRLYSVNLKESFPRHMVVRSAGYTAGRSYVMDLESGEKEFFKRGLSIFGITADGAVEKLGHKDTCGETVSDSIPLKSSIKELINMHSEKYTTFTVLAHDSLICSKKSQLAQLLKGTHLTHWKQADYRTPYIGIVSNNGETIEYLGNKETAIAVEFNTPEG